MPQVRLSRTAERWFLKAIADIAEHNPQAARKLLARLETMRTLLSAYPRMTENGLIPGTRKVSMPPFILITRFRNGTVEIAAIPHARQNDAHAPLDLKNPDENEDDLMGF